MPVSPAVYWWIFLAATIAIVILVTAMGVSAIGSQRRLTTLHRSHARSLLETAEQERAAVAREVHDDTLQRLAVLRHEIQTLDSPGEAESGRALRLKGILGEVDDLIVSLRQLAHQLHPTLLEHVGLGGALEKLADEFHHAHGLRTTLDNNSARTKVPHEHALVLYRIAQEGLHNVVRHAKTTEVSIDLRVTEESTTLIMRDSGAGFDVALPPHEGTLGLMSMQERARHAGGNVHVESAPGQGTTITARLPIPPCSE